ncbi:hypothetical protein SPRG_12377 [Saprolegnia parasitica CBS 223.65]|uniref:Glutathione S-transferase n=1 Tax=Saprolegnia parasitica (strain CBS 223.65) TaxID=695850 RepID=A0A067BYE8_SAPPC|nr:hypothetical protein SPRG_12377 [Saprolegnia parasitica CBS 223.65]KDO21875.1 hypothetical protein SPRG_12377 [Saprolegnia parasitica CBS 223.65]|eukprot:XP_012207430.1 hypothetical protein SPRG_12377 [Saprolegnia parasitica CBS 223.65]
MATTNPITVHYWAGRGMCEPLRVALAAVGAPFTNQFLETKADLTALRDANDLAYGQVPMVEMDGGKFVQVQATLLYLARKHNLYPSELAAQYMCDATMAACADARRPLTGYAFTLDGAKVKSSFNFARYPAKWDELLTGRDYLLGATASMADVTMWEVLDFYEDIFGTALFRADFKAYPALLAHYDRVGRMGNLAQWKAARSTEFVDYATYARHVNQTLYE